MNLLPVRSNSFFLPKCLDLDTDSSSEPRRRHLSRHTICFVFVFWYGALSGQRQVVVSSFFCFFYRVFISIWRNFTDCTFGSVLSGTAPSSSCGCCSSRIESYRFVSSITVSWCWYVGPTSASVINFHFQCRTNGTSAVNDPRTDRVQRFVVDVVVAFPGLRASGRLR